MREKKIRRSFLRIFYHYHQFRDFIAREYRHSGGRRERFKEVYIHKPITVHNNNRIIDGICLDILKYEISL